MLHLRAVLLSLTLVVTLLPKLLVAAASPLSWKGNVSSVWDINSTANWQSNGVAGLYYSDGNPVMFDDTAAGNFVITLSSAVQPLGVTFSNSVNSYSLGGSGSIGGTTWLNLCGGGVLTLSNANSYSGPTTVTDGALVLQHLGAVAGSSLNIADGAVVQPCKNGTYSNITTTINGSSTLNSHGGSLDFHVGGTETWPGQIILNSDTAAIGSFGITCSVILSGQLTGSGSLNFWPEGANKSSHTATFTLSNPTNNYAGSTTIQVGTKQLSATLKLGVNNGLPLTTTLNLNQAGNPGTTYFDLAGYSQTLSAITADSSSNAVVNSSGTAGTLVVSNVAADIFNGTLGAAGAANFSLVKTGGGTLTLGGSNSYTGTTTVNGGTLALTGPVTATSGLMLNSNATLQVAVGGLSGATNAWVNGNVTLAGQLDLIDAGIVSNTAYPVIYYSGTLNTNGLTAAVPKLWAFTIDTSVPHQVRLIPTQSFPMAQFTNGNLSVTTLTTNLGGILRDTTAGPIWYEVRDQGDRLWDFGSTLAVTPWSITVRHLRAGTNTVTVFAQSSGGVTYSNRIQLVLNLGPNSGVRPRPIPSEIWWGGTCSDAVYDANTNMIGSYSRLSQLMQTNGWDYVKRNADGFVLHGFIWLNQFGQLTNRQQLGRSLSAQLAPFNGKFWLEDTWRPVTNNMNQGHTVALEHDDDVKTMRNLGLVVSEMTEDYAPNWQDFCTWHPDWLTNDIRVLVTGNTNQASTNYPYASGLWRDYANDFHQLHPDIQFGWVWSPVWFHWQNGPSLGRDSGIFTITNNGTIYNFNWDFYDYMNDAVLIGNQTGVPFSFTTDCPWNAYGMVSSKSDPAQQLADRNKIRNYEAWLHGQNLRHVQICNYPTMDPVNTNASDLTYESSSLSTLYLHQQEGGRANRYLFESWYEGPYTVVPETQPGSYTHLALSAIKYLKGIADTNGNLEPLNLTALATNGTLKLIQLQNNGDVSCLPALAGQTGTVSGVSTRYFATNGLELTAVVLSAEGLCLTNMLAPAAQTNLIAVTLASNLAAVTNDNAMLEAFWNPQDPLGIVRDRELFAAPLSPPGLWQDSDIGSVGVTGGSALSGTTITVLGSGADIGGNADAFHFVYQTNVGDGVFTVRLSSQLAADSWAKAGLMIRESNAPGARNVFWGLTSGQGALFQNRAATNGASASSALPGITLPCWVQLARSGTTFTANYSTNGVDWVTVGSSNITGFATVTLWGLAVAAHTNTLASVATFDNLTLPNASPVLNPISNYTLVAGQTLTLTNSASDPNSPTQALTYSLPTAPAGMTLNPTNGILVWRPALSQAPSTNSVTVQVADNGTPSLSATQSFQVTVVLPAIPTLAAFGFTSQGFSMQANGSAGPDYYFQMATNLTPPVQWLSLQSNFSATPPLLFTDPSATNFTQRFYRVLLGP